MKLAQTSNWRAFHFATRLPPPEKPLLELGGNSVNYRIGLFSSRC